MLARPFGTATLTVGTAPTAVRCRDALVVCKDALDTFEHPYAYAARRGVDYRLADLRDAA